MDSSIREAISRGDAKLELNEPISWKKDSTRWRASHRLKTMLAVPITLFCGVPIDEPHRPTFLVRDGAPGRNNAYRLDVRGATHVNRRTDLRRWENETHIHEWRDDCQEGHAIDPFPPWPPDGFSENAVAVTSDQLRELFEAFCRMVHIKLGEAYDWVDPTAQTSAPTLVTTEDGDVIP